MEPEILSTIQMLVESGSDDKSIKTYLRTNHQLNLTVPEIRNIRAQLQRENASTTTDTDSNVERLKIDVAASNSDIKESLLLMQLESIQELYKEYGLRNDTKLLVELFKVIPVTIKLVDEVRKEALPQVDSGTFDWGVPGWSQEAKQDA